MNDVTEIKRLLGTSMEAYAEGARSASGTPERDAAVRKLLDTLVGDRQEGGPSVDGTESNERVQGRAPITSKLHQEWDDYRAQDFQGEPFVLVEEYDVPAPQGHTARASAKLTYTAPDGTSRVIPSVARLVKTPDGWRIARASLRE